MRAADMQPRLSRWVSHSNCSSHSGAELDADFYDHGRGEMARGTPRRRDNVDDPRQGQRSTRRLRDSRRRPKRRRTLHGRAPATSQHRHHPKSAAYGRVAIDLSKFGVAAAVGDAQTIVGPGTDPTTPGALSLSVYVSSDYGGGSIVFAGDGTPKRLDLPT
jgi:hypothetical protein